MSNLGEKPLTSSGLPSLPLQEITPRAKALSALGFAAIAFAVAALGQAVINRDVGDRAKWLGSLADPLRGIYEYPHSVLLGAILLALGGVTFAFTVTGRRDGDGLPSKAPAGLPVWLRAGRSLWLIPAAAGIALWVYLNEKLLGGSYKEYYPHILLVSILLVGSLFLTWDRRLGTSFGLRIEWWEVASVAAVVGIFAGLNMRDLDGWRFSAIGDEYSFFDVAHRIAEGSTLNLFSAVGVYDYRPMGGSAFQALSMNIFGSDNFGWKMSNVLLISATLPALYLLTRSLFHRWAAIAAVGVLGFSHHVFAYTHVGYDNLQVILFSVAPFALFIAGLKRSSTLLLFAAGAAAGATAYTYPAARVVPVVMALYLLSLGPRNWKVQTWLPIAIGGALTVAPMLAVSGDSFWTAMSDRSVFGFTDSPTEGVGRRILENIPRTLFIFNYNPGLNDHFVSGSLLDPMAAVFYVMGLIVSLSRFRQNSYRFLLIWLGIGLLTSGIFSPYNRTPEDRMHLDMPAVAIATGIGVWETLRLLAAPALAPRQPWAARYAPLAFLGAFLPIMLFFNAERFWVDTPANMPTSIESVIARAVFSDECKDRASPTVVLSPEPGPLLEPLFRSYDLGGHAPLLIRFDDAIQNTQFDPNACFVLANLFDDRATTLRATLAREYPQKPSEILHDASGLREVLVYR